MPRLRGGWTKIQEAIDEMNAFLGKESGVQCVGIRGRSDEVIWGITLRLKNGSELTIQSDVVNIPTNIAPPTMLVASVLHLDVKAARRATPAPTPGMSMRPTPSANQKPLMQTTTAYNRHRGGPRARNRSKPIPEDS